MSSNSAADQFHCCAAATYHEGAGYRVVVVSELPEGGTR